MKTPLAKYDVKNNDVDYNFEPNLVWAGLLDLRYKIEVVRKEEENYRGDFLIFDGQANDALIHEEEVGVSYGAAFGPDAMDVAQWQDRAATIVDSKV